jgi:two-component system, NarL family, response regulator DesR
MKTIYFVEDEGVLRNLFTEYCSIALSDLKIVGNSGNGQVALQECIEKKPDLAILDIRLPEVSGLEILHILKKRLPDTKVVMFTGITSPDTIQLAIKGKADAFLEKSDGIDQIKQAIESIATGNRYYSPKVYKHILSSQNQGL